MNVHIVMTDTYPRRPTVAFLNHAEAVEAACLIHGLTEDGAEDRIVTVPILAAASPSQAMPQIEFRKDGTLYVSCHPDDIEKFLGVLTKQPPAAAEAPSCDESATD